MPGKDKTLQLAEHLSVGLRGFMLMVRKGGDFLPVTRQQLDVLSALGDGPRRVSDLADEVGVRMPTVTTQLARLERDGLITKGPGPGDARVVMVTLTSEGKRLLKMGLDLWYSGLVTEIEKLTPEEREILAQVTPVLKKLFPLPGSVREATRAARSAKAAKQSGS